MEEKLLTPQEVADILKIRKNTVYDMIKRGDLKATKMGKQFRILQSDVESIVGGNTTPSFNAGKQSSLTKVSPFDMTLPDNNIAMLNNDTVDSNTIILCGQDILLDMLCNRINRNQYANSILRSYLGSYNGLYAMYQGQVHIATAHLWDYKTDTYNTTFIEKLLPGEDIIMFHLVGRTQGFYVAKGNPKEIYSFEDFKRTDIRFINREKGSGTRVLFDGICRTFNLPLDYIPGSSRIVSSHLSAASAVARGSADYALGNERSTYQIKDIDFIPLKEESYDIVMRKKDLEHPVYQAIINILQSSDFQAEINALGGYNTTDMGKIIYP